MCPSRRGDPGDGISYTEWVSAEAARNYYEKQYVRPPANFIAERQAIGYRWWLEEPNVEGFYKMSVAYLHLPFSSSVYARSEEGLDRVCALLTVRSPSTFLGVPTNCART